MKDDEQAGTWKVWTEHITYINLTDTLADRLDNMSLQLPDLDTKRTLQM